MKFISKIARHYQVTIITQSRDDLGLAEQYAKQAGAEVYSYHSAKDLAKLLRVYAKQDLILTQRFHGLIFGLKMGLKVIPLGYHGQKQYKLLHDLGVTNKLLMYHQPERIEQLLAGLANNQLNQEFVLKADRSMSDYLKTSAHQNQVLLAQALPRTLH